MSRRARLLIGALLLLCGLVLVVHLLAGDNVAVLRPAGIVAEKQRNLLLFAGVLSLIVILPVFLLTFFIAVRYREGNTKARYTPEWDHHPLLETLWWGIPIAIIVVLAVVTWRSSHDLDPTKALVSSQHPLTIQVVALQWKWLFIYPEQHIASINYVQFPVDRPVTFRITSDAPMNSFWIPQLGGQIYAMSGMSTQLHLMANRAGNYNGSSANLSGSGFADMKFMAHASSEAEFNNWVNTTQKVPDTLNATTYDVLARPNIAAAPFSYNVSDSALYDTIVMKYMMPTDGMTQ
ncbi:MAG: ubiquinol oxidase subunit II [Candidatus Saccharimonadales bacterium]